MVGGWWVVVVGCLLAVVGWCVFQLTTMNDQPLSLPLCGAACDVANVSIEDSNGGFDFLYSLMMKIWIDIIFIQSGMIMLNAFVERATSLATKLKVFLMMVTTKAFCDVGSDRA